MPKNGPRIKKPPRKPKPEVNPKTRRKRRAAEVVLIGCYISIDEAIHDAARRGISAQIVDNGNRTYSLRRIG